MINLSVPDAEQHLRPHITIFGIGGAGGNAVNNMLRANLEGVDFVVANTDAQALSLNLAERKIQLGNVKTRGLGAGSRPDVGRDAAEEQIEEIRAALEGANMVFVTAGMGGGTGTGAAPVIARTAREMGILTVGVVTKPFHFEGAHRMRTADAGINELQQFVDTLVVIPNQNLFRMATEKTTFADAFKMADDVLHSGVRGVTDLMVVPGLINLDFADIRSVMSEMGKAMMGTGEATGENRSLEAAEAAIRNPLLDDVSMRGARGVLINVTGGMDMTLFEVDAAVNRIREEVDPEANIIFGTALGEQMEGRMRVSVVATGIEALQIAGRPPISSAVRAIGSAAASSSFSANQQTAANNGYSIPAAANSAHHGGGNAAVAAYAAQNAEIDEEEELSLAESLPLPSEVSPDLLRAAAQWQEAVSTPMAENGVEAPRAEQTENGFVAPRAAEPRSYGTGTGTMGAPLAASQSQTQPQQPAASPFESAQQPAPMLTAQPYGQSYSAQQRKPSSLFERVTGLGAFGGGGSHAATPPVSSGSPTTSGYGVQQPEQQVPQQPAPAAAASGERKLTAEEEIDIPAFLRRQGN